jgi:D-lactate dehydrogenase (cytochrome)
LPTGVAYLSDPVELLTYAADAGLESGRPDVVLFPKSAADVERIVAWAAERAVPVVTRGAGTGTSGGAVASGGGIILALSHLQRVVELDEDGRSVVVEPGVVNAELDDLARAHGLFYPPDPASGRACTLGGNIAENAGGPRCCKYGVTSNYVTGLRAVLADGKTVRFGGRALDCPEYEWVGVLTGSEGTLAVITEADLRLLRYPAASRLLMVAFDTVEAAGEAVSEIIARGLTPATIEMMDQTIVEMIEQYAHLGLPEGAAAVLIIEVDGHETSLSPQIDEIAAALSAHGGHDIVVARDAAERARIWNARKGSAGALARLAPAYYPSDCTVPRSKIAQALHEINQICAADGLRVCYLLHAGDGNLHPHILIDDPHDAALMQRVLAAEGQALAFCVAHGGSITGEHGVGNERRHFMPLMYGTAELAAMQDIKDVFDPCGLFNPGKIFPEADRAEVAQMLDAAAGMREGAQGGASPAGRRSEDASCSERGLPAETRGSETHGGHEVAPASAEEAAEVIRSCMEGVRRDRTAEARTTHPAYSLLRLDGIRVRGGGTKSALLPPAGVTLATRSLAGVPAYAPEDLYITTGAGSRLVDLQEKLGRDGLWLPLASPWPEATVGGIASAGFNAPCRMRYGSVRDLVLAVEAVLPDGRVVRLGRPVVKNVAGYDLPKLFVGAQGTLGLLTELTLRITPLPRARASLVVPVEEPGHGIEWGSSLRRVCLAASALLLVPGAGLAGLQSGAHGAPPQALIYTAEGLAEDVAAELASARAVLAGAGAPAGTLRDDITGSDAWAAFLRSGTAGSPQEESNGEGGADVLAPSPVPVFPPQDMGRLALRAAVASKDLSRLMSRLIPALGATPYVADIANSMLYLVAEHPGQLALVRQCALALGGYAVVVDAGPQPQPARHVPEAGREGEPAQATEAGLDRWGYVPQSLALMRKLKARWDPDALFNPGAFLV